MSFTSKLFGKKPPVAIAPVVPVPPPKAPKPDRSAEFAAEEARLTEALSAASEPAIAQFVVDGGSTRIRQRAAEAIQDSDRIRELIRLSRGKDNAVYKILTAKRDAQLELERLATATQQELDAIAAAIARHARLPFDAIYEATLTADTHRWQAMQAHASVTLQSTVNADLDKARAVVQAHHDAIATKARLRQEAADAAARAGEAAQQAQAQATEAALLESARIAAERAEQDLKAQAESETIRELVSLLRQMQAALDRGGSARAARLRDSLTPKLAAVAALSLPSWFQRQLEMADEQLTKLKDWHAFTVGPKRIELLERMQSLIGAEIAPEQLAQHIRKLQDEWKTLHRGAGEDDSEDTERFKELANRAYEPCKVHFAAKAAQRTENKEKREALLVQLTDYVQELEGEFPNWRRVIPNLVEARREWRMYAPVDQEIAEALQARFKAVMTDIAAKLDAEQARNVAAKEALIAQASALITLEDVRQAIDGAKALQRNWKHIGIVPREQDNPLWETFRGHCNAVFERSAQEAAQFETALSAAAERATELIATIEQIATSTGDVLRTAVKGIDALQQEFETLELPRQVARDLYHRFHRAIERCQEAVHHDRNRAVTQAWSDLYTTASAIRAYGWVQHENAADTQLETLKANVDAAIAGLAAAPKFARTAIERHWSKLLTGAVSGDVSANAAALRLLCIRAELATDSATPDADQDLRRDYQMKRLLASRNLGADHDPVSMDDLALEWFTVGPLDPALEVDLQARFERCRATASRQRRSHD